jgi:hypothetical protein
MISDDLTFDTTREGKERHGSHWDQDLNLELQEVSKLYNSFFLCCGKIS